MYFQTACAQIVDNWNAFHFASTIFRVSNHLMNLNELNSIINIIICIKFTDWLVCCCCCWRWFWNSRHAIRSNEVIVLWKFYGMNHFLHYNNNNDNDKKPARKPRIEDYCRIKIISFDKGDLLKWAVAFVFYPALTLCQTARFRHK